MTENLISVVIPAYNAEKTISKTIEAILKQNYSAKLEVIVVDDGSTDRTARVVQTFPQIRYIKQENAGPAAARNRGFKESTGEVIFFIDSDCIPQNDWISKSFKGFSHHNIAVVAGSYSLANPESLLARCIQKEIIFRHQKHMPKFPKSFGSYNFCVRRKVFEEVGGFNVGYPSASGEDNDLSYKIQKAGYKIYFEKESIVGHFHPTKMVKYLFEQFRHGFWRVKMYVDHPRMTTGDDYTFWKDIGEPPVVVFYFLSVMLSPFGLGWLLKASFIMLIGHFIFEIFYGFFMTKNFFEGLFFGFVMFLRSFARTFGFVLGFSLIFASKPAKNN